MTESGKDPPHAQWKWVGDDRAAKGPALSDHGLAGMRTLRADRNRNGVSQLQWNAIGWRHCKLLLIESKYGLAEREVRTSEAQEDLLPYAQLIENRILDRCSNLISYSSDISLGYGLFLEPKCRDQLINGLLNRIIQRGVACRDRISRCVRPVHQNGHASYQARNRADRGRSRNGQSE